MHRSHSDNDSFLACGREGDFSVSFSHPFFHTPLSLSFSVSVSFSIFFLSLSLSLFVSLLRNRDDTSFRRYTLLILLPFFFLFPLRLPPPSSGYATCSWLNMQCDPEKTNPRIIDVLSLFVFTGNLPLQQAELTKDLTPFHWQSAMHEIFRLRLIVNETELSLLSTLFVATASNH